jgi:hypothetical protein
MKAIGHWNQVSRVAKNIRECIRKFPDCPPGARTGNGTAVTRCSCIAILWVSLVNFAAITLCVASQQVFVVVVYFVIDSVRKLLDIPSYKRIKCSVTSYQCLKILFLRPFPVRNVIWTWVRFLISAKCACVTVVKAPSTILTSRPIFNTLALCICRERTDVMCK